MNTLITGATGFIGRHLLEKIVNTRDREEVYCLARTKASCDELEREGISTIRADLKDRSILNERLKNLDIEIVYHLAALARINKSKNEYLINNIAGTENLMECLKSHAKSLKKIIHMSSIHAYPGHNSAYAKSKKKGEEIVIEVCRGMGIPYCILRPPIVYGPGCKADAGLLKFSASASKKSIFSRLNFPGKCSLVHVYDLVRFCICLEKSKEADNQIFSIYSDKCVSIDDIMEKIYRELDIVRKKIKIPGVFYAAIGKMLPLALSLLPSGADLEDSMNLLLKDSWTCDMLKARELLNFEPDYNIDGSIKEVLYCLTKT